MAFDTAGVIQTLVKGYITTKVKKLADVSLVVMQPDQSGVGLSSLRPARGAGNTIERMRLQFFPETLADSKGVDYSQFEPPGSANPLYQWVKSTARTLSMTAVFYRESSEAIVKETKYNVDINRKVAWLRRFLYPDYRDDGTAKPPPRIALYFPKTFLSTLGGSIFPAIMMRCEVGYRTWFMDGTPRLIAVELGFAECSQFSDGILWPLQKDFEDVATGQWAVENMEV